MIKFNFKKFVLVISILIIWNLFINYGIDTFYPEPKRKDFCKKEQVVAIPDNREECVGVGGQWTEDIRRPPVYQKIPRPVEIIEEDRVGWCNVDYTCGQNYDTEKDLYKRNVFIVFVIAGILAIIGGVFITAAETVSSGFLFGGVLSILIGTIRYWSVMDDYLRFIVLGIALFVLIWIGWKKIK